MFFCFFFNFKRGQRTIEGHEEKLHKEEERRDNARAKMEQNRRLLVQVKSDIEHLSNKVHHLKAVSFILSFYSLFWLISYEKRK